MLDQLRIGDKYSYDDFGASVASRSIQPPAKKVIKETVPFSNVTYDFSKINGELYWEERELEYIFEILADSPEELETKKIAFSAWVMNVMNENIYDPYEPDFHYVGTFDGLDYSDEDSVEKTTAMVTFFAYPYKVANEANVYSVEISSGTKIIDINNTSAHRITPTVVTDYPISIIKDGVSYSFDAGTSLDDIFALKIGWNKLSVVHGGNRAFLVEGDVYSAISFLSYSFYATCVANTDGTYTLSDPVALSYAEALVGCWFEDATNGLMRVVSVLGSTDGKAVNYSVETGLPDTNVEISFNREVF